MDEHGQGDGQGGVDEDLVVAGVPFGQRRVEQGGDADGSEPAQDERLGAVVHAPQQRPERPQGDEAAQQQRRAEDQGSTPAQFRPLTDRQRQAEQDEHRQQEQPGHGVLDLVLLRLVPLGDHLPEDRDAHEDGQQGVGAQQLAGPEQHECQRHHEGQVGALLHEPVPADDDEQPAQQEARQRPEHRRAEHLPQQDGGQQLVPRPVRLGQQQHREEDEEVGQSVVEPALGREVVPDPLGNPLLGQGTRDDRGGDHGVGRGDDRAQQQRHQERHAQRRPQHAGGHDEHQGHAQPDDHGDPAGVAAPVAVRQAQGDPGQAHRQGDPRRLLQQRSRGQAEVLDPHEVQRVGADQRAEREGEHRAGETDPLQQRRERRDQQDGSGEERQHQVDVHRRPSVPVGGRVAVRGSGCFHRNPADGPRGKHGGRTSGTGPGATG